MINARETCETAVARFGAERVLVPELLRVRMRQQSEAQQNDAATSRAGTSCRRSRTPSNKAVAHLNRQGFGTYLPRYLKRRRHARRVEVVAGAAVPTISFRRDRYRRPALAFDLLDDRCFALVCNGDCPDAAIPDEIIGHLEGARGRGGFVQLDQRPNFRSGDKIRVLDGVFADCLGLYDGMKDSDRVAVLLDLLGRKVRVMVDVESVAAA